MVTLRIHSVADDLAPNMRQAINNRHADSAMATYIHQGYLSDAANGRVPHVLVVWYIKLLWTRSIIESFIRRKDDHMALILHVRRT